ncbi:DUF1285 domain-containing protein [uncultured Shewanella sp.]|uniref:DUF1285 domain-containing protein n=1 Tax=uncultured Shewanella sp. TaxID=173975 RepID=UPI0026250F6F|nr:DUF1285 domain-containing protein [uncultured Shewanella sp.]
MTSKKELLTQVTDAISSLTQNTPLCTEEAIFEINANGDWFYRGGKLPLKFSKLFASILNRIGEEYFLITPVEKLRVAVLQQALMIVDYQCETDASFTLKSSIDTEHTISSFEQFVIGEDSVTLPLERGVEARLNRACFYRFIDEFIA